MLAAGLVIPWLLPAQSDIHYDPWDWITYENCQFVSSISEGKEYLYVGSNGGILRYQMFGKYWDNPITKSQGMSDDKVSAVYYDFHTHVLWASTRSGLNYSMDGGRSWSLATNSSLGLRPGEIILRIGSTGDYLWCLTSSQVLKLDHLSGFVLVPYAELADKGITWGSSRVVENRNWPDLLSGFVATGGWMYDLDVLRGPNGEEVLISTSYLDRFGDLWLGTWGGPVFYGDFQMRYLEPIPFGPAQTNAETLVRGEKGMWMGGSANPVGPSGITFYDDQRGYWDHFRKDYEITFGQDEIYCGIRAENEWWFGTTEGIQVYTPEKSSWSLVGETKGLPDSRVTSIAFDGDYVYAGTPMGLVRMSPGSRRRVDWHVSDLLSGLRIHALHWDGEDLWISSDRGLWRWQPQTGGLRTNETLGESTQAPNPSSTLMVVDGTTVTTAIVSSDSMVYFGDAFGVLAYNKIKNEWHRLTGQSRLVGHYVTSLALSSDPYGGSPILWVGTTKGVFMVSLSDGHIRHFEERDGLAGNFVGSIVVDDVAAWFGTTEGLCRFNWVKYTK